MLLFAGVVAWAAACGSKKSAGVAELTKADGPVDREAGSGAWEGAKVGAQFYSGDAERTADGGAELRLVGTQRIAMNAHTVLRFAPGKNNSTNLTVEVGGIDVINSGSADLEIGDVHVAPGGKIHITNNQVELVIGKAQFVGADGKSMDLTIGTPICSSLRTPSSRRTFCTVFSTIFCITLAG